MENNKYFCQLYVTGNDIDQFLMKKTLRRYFLKPLRNGFEIFLFRKRKSFFKANKSRNVEFVCIS